MNGCHQGKLLGVCALLADLAGVPVWLPRVAFALFAMAHLWLAIIAYGALFALVERREKLRRTSARGLFSDIRPTASERSAWRQ